MWQPDAEEVFCRAGALEVGLSGWQDTSPDTTLQVVEKWEAVTEVDVQTPLEVYQELKGEQPPYPDGKCCSVGQAHCRKLAAELLGNSKSCLRLEGRAWTCNWTPTEAALL